MHNSPYDFRRLPEGTIQGHKHILITQAFNALEGSIFLPKHIDWRNKQTMLDYLLDHGDAVLIGK